jgi:hypothetical protein
VWWCSSATTPPTAAAIAAAAAVATISAAASAATAAGARATLFSDVDAKLTAFEILAIELSDGFLRVFWGCHLHERKATRLSGRAVEHHVNGANLATLHEALSDQILGGVKR